VISSIEAVDEKVFKGVAETMESLVFEEVVIGEILSEFTPGDYKAVWASIPVLEPSLGNFAVWFPLSVIIGFTQTVQAVPEEEVSVKKIRDNLGELINTICGRVLAAWMPPNRTFLLGLPETHVDQAFTPDANQRIIKFLVGNAFFFVMIPGCFWDTKPQ